MATHEERIKGLEDRLDEVLEYLLKHVLTPEQENEGKINRRKKK